MKKKTIEQVKDDILDLLHNNDISACIIMGNTSGIENFMAQAINAKDGDMRAVLDEHNRHIKMVNELCNGYL